MHVNPLLQVETQELEIGEKASKVFFFFLFCKHILSFLYVCQN